MKETSDQKLAQAKQLLMKLPLFREEFEIPINYTPLRVFNNTSMSQVYYILLMLQVDEIFVENWEGELVKA